jgi:hypothetical protein
MSCRAGTYSGTAGVIVCIDCLAGTYSNTVGATSACISCPAGKTSLSKSKSANQCFELDCTGYSSTASCPQKCPANSVGPLNGCTMSMTTSDPTSSCSKMAALQYSTSTNNWFLQRSERSASTCYGSYFSTCFASCSTRCKPSLTTGVFKANTAVQFNAAVGEWVPSISEVNQGTSGQLIESFGNPKWNLPVRTSGLTIVTVVKLKTVVYAPNHIFTYSMNGGADLGIHLGREQYVTSGQQAVTFRMFGYSALGLKMCYLGIDNIPSDEWVTIIARVDKYVSGMPDVFLHVITQDGTTYTKKATICSSSREYTTSFWVENCCDWNYDTGIFDDRVQSWNGRFVGSSYNTNQGLFRGDIAGLVATGEFMSLPQALSLAEAFKYGNNLITPQCMCDFGYYFDVTSMSCVSCPVNTYKDKIGDNACLSCPYDSSTTGMLGASVCTYKCEIGFYMSQGVCLSCEIGNYVQYGVTEDKCLICQVGTYIYI